MRRYPEIVGVLVALVCLAGFWELAEDFAYSPAVLRFDAVVSSAIQSWRGPVLTPLMIGMTIAGGTVCVTLATLAGSVWLWRGRHPYQARLFAATVIGGMALSTVAKNAFDRPRPPLDNAIIKLPASFSFPSGHTMASLCVSIALGYVLARSDVRTGRKALFAALLLAYPVLVGTSRVYLGVHWPSDVLASWLLAAAWASLLVSVYEGRRRRGLKPAP